jgi:nucleoside-diphosphate-sugar epimerase
MTNQRTTIVSGATGYLGSHLLTGLLESCPNQTAICLARPRGGVSARDRVLEAVHRAWADQGHPGLSGPWADRVEVFEEDLCATRPILDPQTIRRIRGLEPDSFWHCAASVKFVQSRDAEVWAANVEGVKSALVLADVLRAGVFNHVSTAYVAGTLSGVIPETIEVQPERFNNVYEQSKHHGERLVEQYCRTHGLRYRIFRPSIIVGHSRTHRSSSSAGIYHVLGLFQKFREVIGSRYPGYFDHHPLRVHLEPAATLNMIPIDRVVEEMLDVHAGDQETLGEVFHLTTDAPPCSLEAVERGLAVVGIPRLVRAREVDLTTIDKLFSRGLSHFHPYLNAQKVFQRNNAIRHGVNPRLRGLAVTAAEVEQYARNWLESNLGRQAA